MSGYRRAVRRLRSRHVEGRDVEAAHVERLLLRQFRGTMDDDTDRRAVANWERLSFAQADAQEPLAPPHPPHARA